MRYVFLATCVALTLVAHAAEVRRAPAGERYVELDPQGETVLPNGRLITPEGEMHRVQPHPFGLTMSADGRWVVAVSSDGPQLTVLDFAPPPGGGRAFPAVYYIPDTPTETPGVLDACFMGAAIGPDNQTLYIGGGSAYSVQVYDLEARKRIAEISCDHRIGEERFRHGYVGDLRLTKDGKTLYIVDQSNFHLLVIDVPSQQVINAVPVGRYPFGVALSGDERFAFVANVGMFEYGYHRDANGKITRIPFPPFAFGSDEARDGVTLEDGTVVPALGDPNDIAGMSVWKVDLGARGAETVVAKAKTGHLVGEQLEDFPAVGGSSPNSMAVARDKVYVSNGSNDSISVIALDSGEHVHDIDLTLDPRLAKWRGMIPFGLALSPDHARLYVALAGINAIGVIDLDSERVVGFIPTAWFPSKLAVSPDGKRLYVSCAKGIGSGPNAGPGHQEGDPTGIGALMRGYIHIVSLPENDDAYAALTRKVVDNNVVFAQDTRPATHPIPPAAGAWTSPIKHVIYVTKENRTYDEIYGANKGGRGDAELCRLGRPINVSNEDGSRTVKDVVLMPNHIALAERFAISDNFYCDSDHSTDGHRWLVGTYPNEFMEAKIGEDARGDGPGNALFIGSSGAIYPEDYNEAGSIWEHFERGGKRFRNYGLGFEFKPADQRQEYADTGIRLTINYPMPKALFENTSRTFQTYNTNIPDQFRIDRFIEEFEERWVSGKEPFPDVITMMLPNDHGAGERPDDGYPFWGSYMSDNDLALGRLVELISHSPWWKETVIFVTEDDAQGYTDTVDAHRSICLVIGPWVKPGYVSHTHTSMSSILKTMYQILGLPPLNQYDAFASDLHDMFALAPENDAPYQARPVNAEIFDPQLALDPFDKEFNWEAAAEFVPMDDQKFLNTDRYGNAGTPDHAPRDAGTEDTE